MQAVTSSTTLAEISLTSKDGTSNALLAVTASQSTKAYWRCLASGTGHSGDRYSGGSATHSGCTL